MNPWFDVVDSLKLREERFIALSRMTDGRIGARANRGRSLPFERVEALIWGLQHASPVVRRCCLELLDQHPDNAQCRTSSSALMIPWRRLGGMPYMR